MQLVLNGLLGSLESLKMRRWYTITMFFFFFGRPIDKKTWIDKQSISSAIQTDLNIFLRYIQKHTEQKRLQWLVFRHKRCTRISTLRNRCASKAENKSARMDVVRFVWKLLRKLLRTSQFNFLQTQILAGNTEIQLNCSSVDLIPFSNTYTSYALHKRILNAHWQNNGIQVKPLIENTREIQIWKNTLWPINVEFTAVQMAKICYRRTMCVCVCVLCVHDAIAN